MSVRTLHFHQTSYSVLWIYGWSRVRVNTSVDAAVTSLKATAQYATEEGIPRTVLAESKPRVHFLILYDIILRKNNFYRLLKREIRLHSQNIFLLPPSNGSGQLSRYSYGLDDRGSLLDMVKICIFLFIYICIIHIIILYLLLLYLFIILFIYILHIFIFDGQEWRSCISAPPHVCILLLSLI
jgi:hypothetical protein